MWSIAALWVICSSQARNDASARKRPKTVEGAQERVLADVLGLVAARDPRGDAHDHVAVALDERLERTQVPAQGRLHVGVVGVGRRA